MDFIQVKNIVFINSPKWKNIGLQTLFDNKYQVKH